MEIVELNWQPRFMIKVTLLEFIWYLTWKRRESRFRSASKRFVGKREHQAKEAIKFRKCSALCMNLIASENTLYHGHCWLSTNSKAIFLNWLESHFQSRQISKLIVKHL